MAVRVRNGPGWDLLRSPGPDESYEWYEWYEFAIRSNFIAKELVPAVVRVGWRRGGRYEFRLAQSPVCEKTTGWDMLRKLAPLVWPGALGPSELVPLTPSPPNPYHCWYELFRYKIRTDSKLVPVVPLVRIIWAGSLGLVRTRTANGRSDPRELVPPTPFQPSSYHCWYELFRYKIRTESKLVPLVPLVRLIWAGAPEQIPPGAIPNSYRQPLGTSSEWPWMGFAPELRARRFVRVVRMVRV